MGTVQQSRFTAFCRGGCGRKVELRDMHCTEPEGGRASASSLEQLKRRLFAFQRVVDLFTPPQEGMTDVTTRVKRLADELADVGAARLGVGIEAIVFMVKEAMKDEPAAVQREELPKPKQELDDLW